MELLADLVEAKELFYKELDKLINGVKSTRQLHKGAIENFTADLHNLIWSNRATIWTDQQITEVMQIVNPIDIFEKVMGYGCDNTRELGYNWVEGEWMDVAGVIDKKTKVVNLSSHVKPEVQNFTAAHELAHALFHDELVLHRDVPIDSPRENKSAIETQADNFAAAFLMPRKLVRARFKEVFGSGTFTINTDTTFKLKGTTAIDLKKETKDINGLCRLLAEAKSYEGVAIVPLMDIFGVSRGAMANRLKELGLVSY